MGLLEHRLSVPAACDRTRNEHGSRSSTEAACSSPSWFVEYACRHIGTRHVIDTVGKFNELRSALGVSRWVYHGLLIGTPRDAVTFLHGLLSGHLLSKASLTAMQHEYRQGGALPGRPWTQGGYGLGLMIGTVT